MRADIGGVATLTDAMGMMADMAVAKSVVQCCCA